MRTTIVLIAGGLALAAVLASACRPVEKQDGNWHIVIPPEPPVIVEEAPEEFAPQVEVRPEVKTNSPEIPDSSPQDVPEASAPPEVSPPKAAPPKSYQSQPRRRWFPRLFRR